MIPQFGLIIVGDEILSGKRADKHLPKVIELLAARGLPLAYAEYVGDDPVRITATLARAFEAARTSGDVVFSTGGIGATPDDHTRQCAARALGVGLALHPEAKRLIEERMQDTAKEQGVAFDADRPDNLHRLNMGVFPAGADIIPNPYNKIPGFSCFVERASSALALSSASLEATSLGTTNEPPGVGTADPSKFRPQDRLGRTAGGAAPSGGSDPHAVGERGGIHFVPGFPVMAWPMVEWVLDHHYAHLHQKSAFIEKSIIVMGSMEATLTPLMLQIEAEHAGVKVFSLPSVDHPEYGRHIELGVKGTPEAVSLAYPALIAGLDQFNLQFGPQLVR
ncbi:MAG: molybdopterin binding domain protein [Polaromonas sp.]|nr:molybdopterin binding domain protein [Polaromonas sp.]